jgi:hypothetical protein
VFGLQAKSKNDEALQPQNCRTSSLCTPNGLSLTNDARNAATLSTIGFIAGGTLVAAGVVLWIAAPRSSAPATGAVRVAPEVARDYGGITVAGAW